MINFEVEVYVSYMQESEKYMVNVLITTPSYPHSYGHYACELSIYNAGQSHDDIPPFTLDITYADEITSVYPRQHFSLQLTQDDYYDQCAAVDEEKKILAFIILHALPTIFKEIRAGNVNAQSEIDVGFTHTIESARNLLSLINERTELECVQ